MATLAPAAELEMGICNQRVETRARPFVFGLVFHVEESPLGCLVSPDYPSSALSRPTPLWQTNTTWTAWPRQAAFAVVQVRDSQMGRGR